MIIIVIEMTTVHVETSTLQLLKSLKEEMEVDSIDDTIRTLIVQSKKIPESMFGSHPKMTSFTQGDKGEFHDL